MFPDCECVYRGRGISQFVYGAASAVQLCLLHFEPVHEPLVPLCCLHGMVVQDCFRRQLTARWSAAFEQLGGCFTESNGYLPAWACPGLLSPRFEHIP